MSEAGVKEGRTRCSDGPEIATAALYTTPTLSPGSMPSGMEALTSCVTDLGEMFATNLESSWLSQGACDDSIVWRSRKELAIRLCAKSPWSDEVMSPPCEAGGCSCPSSNSHKNAPDSLTASTIIISRRIGPPRIISSKSIPPLHCTCKAKVPLATRHTLPGQRELRPTPL